LVICQKFGVKTNIEELSKLSNYRENQGTTMLGLYNAAKEKGLQATGMKISLDEISKLEIPAIAHLWDNHFVVVEGTGTDTIIVTDSPKEPQRIAKDKFKPFYSGFALLVSKDKISLPASDAKEPDIRFDSYTYSFEKVEPGQKIEHTFIFRNTGKTDLEISNVRATCGCTPANVTEKTIKPNGKGDIKVSFDTAGRSGLQNHKIYVQTNDPVTPIVQLQIQGIVKADLAISPRSITFGDVKKGTTVAREIYLIDKTGEDIKITKVESNTGFLSAAVSPITDRPYQGSKILVSLSPETPLCSMEGKVTIYTTDKKHPKVEIPVTANIIGDVEFYPSVLFFGFVKKGKTPTTKIAISTTSETPLQIERVESDISCISTSVKTTKKGKVYTLSARLNKDVPAGNIKGNVTVYTNNPDQPEIKIPVYGLVEE
jgi:hypothetical protein